MDDWSRQCQQMVETQLVRRGITDPLVLDAMQLVPRHRFVPQSLHEHAYDDSALPLSNGQTISQPYIVGLMSQLASISPGSRVLEIGTGSGYQAAVLAAMGAQVHTVERLPELAQAAETVLYDLGYAGQVRVHVGDGFLGWLDAAPYDSILVACAVSRIPDPLVSQLNPKGKLILPVGDSLEHQQLTVVTQTKTHGFNIEPVLGVVFVPMTGPHGFSKQ